MTGIFDSGVGGLSVYREIRKLLPGEDYIYFSDNAHCPYGEKPVEYVVDRAFRITEMLVSKGADIIVVACNTATAAAISSLRQAFSDPEDPAVRQRMLSLSDGRRDHVKFIGMEPAVKPAVSLTRSGVVGVLATAGTLKAEKYRHTRDLAHDRITVVEHVGQGFVELVERGELSGPDAEEVVRASVQPLLDKGADTIVLGCTHYPFLADTIRKVAGPDVTIIDPAPAVARHVVEVMEEDGVLSAGRVAELSSDHTGHSVFLSSGPDDVLKRMLSML